MDQKFYEATVYVSAESYKYSESKEFDLNFQVFMWPPGESLLSGDEWQVP